MKGYINADIWKRKETAFLIEDGVFRQFGTNEEIEEHLSSQDELIDLNGAFVIPGFTDSHMHLLEYGHYLNHVQLAGCRSIDDVLARIRGRLESEEPVDWILARGFNEEEFDHPEMPDKQMLDNLSRNVPICLTRVCGHKMVCNSKALQLAGIEADSEIEGGRIDFEHGLLEETALNVMHQAWPEETIDSLKQAILKGASAANRYGITSVGSDDFLSVTKDWRKVLDAFLQLSYQQKLTVRVNEQCEFDSPEELAGFLDEGYTTDVGDDLFRIGPLKMVTDGSLGARTAALSEPYTDAKDTRGYAIYTKAELRTYLELANRYNMPAICHAIGDKVLNQVLDLYKDLVLPGNPLHYGIVHCQIMTPEQIQKVLDQNLVCYFQSLFIDSDAKILKQRVGEKRAASSYPFRTLYEGTLACNGSDAPVETPDPLKGIQLAVTRTSLDGRASMNPKECMSVEEALTSYTEKGPEAFFSEHTGKLETGYHADFAVLEKNILNIPAETISQVRVLMTVLGGEEVYEVSKN